MPCYFLLFEIIFQTFELERTGIVNKIISQTFEVPSDRLKIKKQDICSKHKSILVVYENVYITFVDGLTPDYSVVSADSIKSQ